MGVLRWRSTGLWALGWEGPGRGALLTAGQLREAVGGAHVAGGPGTVPLQGQLKEPLTQGAHMPVAQLPQGLVLTPMGSWGPSGIPVPDMQPGTRLLGRIVLGVGFGLFIGGQLLTLAGLRAQPVEGILCQVGLTALVLLALGLLPGGLLQHLSVLGCQDLGGGLGATCAPSPGPTPQGLLLDGQQRARLRQVAIAQLLLDETVQDCPRGVFQRPHASSAATHPLAARGTSPQGTWEERKKSNEGQHAGKSKAVEGHLSLGSAANAATY